MGLLWTFALWAVALQSELAFANVDDDHPRPKACELELPVTNDIFHQRYLVNLTIGTPPQSFALALDSASTDIWVPTANSSACRPNCPPPTFEPATSSTINELDIGFNATYGLTPDLQVTGEYYTDTLKLGGAVIPNMTANWFQFAIGNIPPEIYKAGIYGLFGVGSRYGEALFTNPSSPFAGNKSATYDTIYDQLKRHGYIKKRLFSIWLNKQSAKVGSILFGGIDKAKYHGQLKSTPVLLSGPDKLFTGWTVNLTSVSRIDGSSGAKDVLLEPSGGLSTILDTGSPNMYMPSALANTVATQLNATMVSGFAYVSCQFRKSRDALEFKFAGPTGGPRIRVPYPEIIYPFGAPSNLGNVTADDGTELCYLGLIPTDGFIRLLGDTFLRSAYVVLDVDNLEVSMAQAAYTH